MFRLGSELSNREEVTEAVKDVKSVLEKLSIPETTGELAEQLVNGVDKLRDLHSQGLTNNNNTGTRDLRALSQLSGLFNQMYLDRKFDKRTDFLQGNVDAFITKDTFRNIYGLSKQDYVDACHIIANNNGGPCHVYNLNMGSTGKNRSDKDKNDAENIFALAGQGTKVGQHAINAVWSCLWCQKFVQAREDVKKHSEALISFGYIATFQPNATQNTDNYVNLLQNSGNIVREHVHNTEKNDDFWMKYFPHSEKNTGGENEKKYVKFLDSKLMKPFMDMLCSDLQKNKHDTVEWILSEESLDKKPYTIPAKDEEEAGKRKTSDYIIAHWLFNIGKAKDKEHKDFQTAKTTYEERHAEVTKEYTDLLLSQLPA